LKPVIEIIPEAIFFNQTNLFCEISRDGFSYVFANDQDKKFHGLSVFHFASDGDASKQLKEIFKEQHLLHKTYKKIFVCHSVAESALLPEELYTPNESELLLDTFFGDMNDETVATDIIADKKIYNVYRLPAVVQQAMIEKFPTAVFKHQFSLLIKNNFPACDLFKIIFYRNTFVAVLIKAGELQIINTYDYLSGEDVVYHLLNLCHQFKMTDVPLLINGSIEIDSDLHKEISHYFKNINFDRMPAEYEYANGLKELKPHYFSHLFSLALCV
jgi:hypothetical protein